jgi:hypothetical protein
MTGGHKNQKGTLKPVAALYPDQAAPPVKAKRHRVGRGGGVGGG